MPGSDLHAQRLSVHAALIAMQSAVRSGDMLQASQLGKQAVLPLSLTAADLKVSAKIAVGGGSVVHRGTWNETAVAVKHAVFRTTADLDRFRKELLILARLHHPNIVPLLGARALPPDYLLVMPLLEGSLQHMLYEQGWRPSWRQLLDLALQLAGAVEHMHGCGVVHRDIKPANVLMAATGAVCLADFGIAEDLQELEAAAADLSGAAAGKRPTGGFSKRHRAGTLEYMAPEVLHGNPHRPPADIYALAVTINELCTGIQPFSDCTKDNPDCHTVLEMGYGRQELTVAVASEGLRPTLPPRCPPGFKELLTDCWRLEPGLRPDAAAMQRRLEAVAAALDEWEAGLLSTKHTQPAPMVEVDGRGDVMTEDMSATDCYGSNDASTTDAPAHAPDPQMGRTTGISKPDEAAGPPPGSSAVPGDASVPTGVGAAPCLQQLLLQQTLPTVSGGFYAIPGARESMEDRHLMASPLAGQAGLHVFAVFDGHRGHEAADYCAAALPATLLGCLQHAQSAAGALRSAFLAMDQEFVGQQEAAWQERLARVGSSAAGERRYPGCTALAVLLAADRLLLANAGDCRAVLCRAGSAVRLSRDHNAEDESERKRILAAGGQVSLRHGNWRVGAAGLAVSRSIGDADEKLHGLTAEPEVVEQLLQPEDEFLVIASDGLWECVSDQEAVGLVQDTVKQPHMAAKRLVAEAVTRCTRDNVTAGVIFLKPVSTMQTVFAHGQEMHRSTPTFWGSRGAHEASQATVATADEMADTY